MLIDATIYIELLRRGEDLPFILRPYLIANQLFTCGVVRAEVLRGIRSVQLRDEISDLFDLMIEVPTGLRVWTAVVHMAWTLDRRGIVLPLTDIAIGCCALDTGTIVVTSDPHFSRIPGLQTKRMLN
jgi:predicted nucleic acid-binding protein